MEDESVRREMESLGILEEMEDARRRLARHVHSPWGPCLQMTRYQTVGYGRYHVKVRVTLANAQESIGGGVPRNHSPPEKLERLEQERDPHSILVRTQQTLPR